jgi:proteasome lid subunit RPN8/RPN11
VPFEEDDKDPSVWFLDHNYVESMNDMFKKINAREKLVGWYHSGPKLRASDLEINELFKRYTPNPLLVIIDVQPKEAGVPTDAYFAVEEIKDVRVLMMSMHTVTDSYRMEPPPPRRSYTRPRSSRLRKQRRLAWSIY